MTALELLLRLLLRAVLLLLELLLLLLLLLLELLLLLLALLELRSCSDAGHKGKHGDNLMGKKYLS